LQLVEPALGDLDASIEQLLGLKELGLGGSQLGTDLVESPLGAAQVGEADRRPWRKRGQGELEALDEAMGVGARSAQLGSQLGGGEVGANEVEEGGEEGLAWGGGSGEDGHGRSAGVWSGKTKGARREALRKTRGASCVHRSHPPLTPPCWTVPKKELTLLRAEVPWINDLPANVGQAMLAHLDDAWKDFFAGKAGQPGFKVKDRDTMSIEEPSKTCWRLDARKNCLRFPKLGNVPLTLHQPLEGTPKTCSLVRDVDQWFAHITCEIEVPESTHEPSPSVIAIDLGVEVAFADSSGRLVPNPRLGEALAPTLAKRQRQLAKKQKGSNNRKKEKVKVAKVHRKLRRQRENFLHTWSHRYAKNHSVVVIEDLKLKNMTRSARGTESEPGRNVAQKAGLNRALLDVAPGRFMSMLEYKTERHGGVVEHVPAAYSSQECSVCGHVASENRPTRSRFCCMACGHEDHADTNAAKVLMQRYTRRTGGEAACGGTLEAGPMKQEPKPARARTKATKTRAKSLGLQASSLPKTIDPP
jgi:putative transposase